MDGWDKFWKKRNKPLTPKIEMAFKSNFAAIHAIMLLHWEGTGSARMRSLEIGCGRAITSDYLERVGFETWTMDKLFLEDNRHFFLYGDVMSHRWPLECVRFDVIVSYGLLEHFTYVDQSRIINNCVKYLIPGGIQIHYVVPQKITNIFEDRSVYRDKCEELLDEYDSITWTYPIIGESWITDKWRGKGFIIYKVKENEDTCVSYSEITQH